MFTLSTTNNCVSVAQAAGINQISPQVLWGGTGTFKTDKKATDIVSCENTGYYSDIVSGHKIPHS